MATDGGGRNTESPRFHGRRKGPSLSPRKKSILAVTYPRLGLSRPEQRPGGLDPVALFDVRPERFELEIGFGKGEHLVRRAAACPDTGFIGCEPYVNGLVACLDRLAETGVANVRVYDDDARHILDALPDASVDHVHLIHPDPWPKLRHAGRRFVNPDNLARLARVLKDGGRLDIVTDHPVYRQWALIRLTRHPDFDWLAARAADCRRPPEDWEETRYARKAQREGRWDCFLRYRRRPRPKA